MGKFEIFVDKASKYRFRLKAGNGEIILASQGYTTKAGVNTGVESVKTNAPQDERYEKKQTDAGWSFNLKAANGEVIGRSEVYKSASGRDNGIESVKKNAPTADVVEVD